MLFEKISKEVIEHFLSEVDKNGYMDKFKETVIEPTIIHVSKYFNKYIMYFYTILILLIAFIILLIIIMIKVMSKLAIIDSSISTLNLLRN